MSLSAFPPQIDEFPTFIDEGLEIEESLMIPTISPFFIVLQQIPKGPSRNVNGAIEGTTVFINGYYEVQGTPEYPDQYSVDYNTGMITFHPNQEGTTVTVSYQTAGNLVKAYDINKIQDAILNIENAILNEHPSGNLLPGIDATYDIGSPLLQWRDGYFSGKLTVVGGIDPEYIQLTPQPDASNIPNNSIWIDAGNGNAFTLKDNLGNESVVTLPSGSFLPLAGGQMVGDVQYDTGNFGDLLVAQAINGGTGRLMFENNATPEGMNFFVQGSLLRIGGSGATWGGGIDLSSSSAILAIGSANSPDGVNSMYAASSNPSQSISMNTTNSWLRTNTMIMGMGPNLNVTGALSDSDYGNQNFVVNMAGLSGIKPNIMSMGEDAGWSVDLSGAAGGPVRMILEEGGPGNGNGFLVDMGLYNGVQNSSKLQFNYEGFIADLTGLYGSTAILEFGSNNGFVADLGGAYSAPFSMRMEPTSGFNIDMGGVFGANGYGMSLGPSGFEIDMSAFSAAPDGFKFTMQGATFTQDLAAFATVRPGFPVQARFNPGGLFVDISGTSPLDTKMFHNPGSFQVELGNLGGTTPDFLRFNQTGLRYLGDSIGPNFLLSFENPAFSGTPNSQSFRVDMSDLNGGLGFDVSGMWGSSSELSYDDRGLVFRNDAFNQDLEISTSGFVYQNTTFGDRISSYVGTVLLQGGVGSNFKEFKLDFNGIVLDSTAYATPYFAKYLNTGIEVEYNSPGVGKSNHKLTSTNQTLEYTHATFGSQFIRLQGTDITIDNQAWGNKVVLGTAAIGIQLDNVANDGQMFKVVGGIMDMVSTGAFKMPAGLTASRPLVPVNGMQRYNSTTLRTEIYENGVWTNQVRTLGDQMFGSLTFDLTPSPYAAIEGIGGTQPLLLRNNASPAGIEMFAQGSQLRVMNDGSPLISMSASGNTFLFGGAVNKVRLTQAGGGTLNINDVIANGIQLKANGGDVEIISSTPAKYAVDNTLSSLLMQSANTSSRIEVLTSGLLLEGNGPSIELDGIVGFRYEDNSGTQRLRLANGSSIFQMDVDEAIVSGTAMMRVARGTTAERPSVPVGGDTRFNIDTGKGEMYDGSVWNNLW